MSRGTTTTQPGDADTASAGRTQEWRSWPAAVPTGWVATSLWLLATAGVVGATAALVVMPGLVDETTRILVLVAVGGITAAVLPFVWRGFVRGICARTVIDPAAGTVTPPGHDAVPLSSITAIVLQRAPGAAKDALIAVEACTGPFDLQAVVTKPPEPGTDPLPAPRVRLLLHRDPAEAMRFVAALQAHTRVPVLDAAMGMPGPDVILPLADDPQAKTDALPESPLPDEHRTWRLTETPDGLRIENIAEQEQPFKPGDKIILVVVLAVIGVGAAVADFLVPGGTRGALTALYGVFFVWFSTHLITEGPLTVVVRDGGIEWRRRRAIGTESRIIPLSAFRGVAVVPRTSGGGVRTVIRPGAGGQVNVATTGSRPVRRWMQLRLVGDHHSLPLSVHDRQPGSGARAVEAAWLRQCIVAAVHQRSARVSE